MLPDVRKGPIVAMGTPQGY